MCPSSFIYADIIVNGFTAITGIAGMRFAGVTYLLVLSLSICT